MTTDQNDEPRAERADDEDVLRTRSTSRDLDAIAERLASARAGAAQHPETTSASDAVDTDRARDVERLRKLFVRTSTDDTPDETPARSDDTALAAPSYHDDAQDRSQPAGATTDRSHETAHSVRSALQFPREDEIADLQRPMPPLRPRRLSKTIATGAAVALGLVLAIGAYAGGAEYISELLDVDAAERAARTVSIVQNAVVIDSALSAADSIANAEELAAFGERPGDTIRRAPFGIARRAATPSRLRDSVRIAAAVGVTSTPTATPSSAHDASIAQAAASVAKPERASAVSFTVQVRATPERAEAHRLAAQLRARGARDVTITTTTKNGATVYRVRYGSFESAEAARASARSNGHADAWAVRR